MLLVTEIFSIYGLIVVIVMETTKAKFEDFSEDFLGKNPSRKRGMFIPDEEKISSNSDEAELKCRPSPEDGYILRDDSL